MGINCEGFQPLDYEFLLEKNQSIELYNGTKGVITSVYKPFISIKLKDGRIENNIHWMNIKSVRK